MKVILSGGDYGGEEVESKDDIINIKGCLYQKVSETTAVYIGKEED